MRLHVFPGSCSWCLERSSQEGIASRALLAMANLGSKGRGKPSRPEFSHTHPPPPRAQRAFHGDDESHVRGGTFSSGKADKEEQVTPARGQLGEQGLGAPSSLVFVDCKEPCVEMGAAEAWGARPGARVSFTGEPNGMKPRVTEGPDHPPDPGRPRALHGAPSYLPVPLQRGREGPLVAKQLQALVSIIVAQLLEGGRPVLPLVPRVLEAWRVHHHDGSHGEVVGREGPGGRAGEASSPRGI